MAPTFQSYLRNSFRALHRQIDEAASGLTAEQVHWLPPGTKANHLGFTLWHYVRTEDNIVHFVLQDRRPTVWMSGRYHERFGLDKAAQGTGMPTEDANSLRLPSMDRWMEYQRTVWSATEEYAATISDEELERTLTVRPFGEITVQLALTQVCLTHGHAHFGEMCLLRVLQGLDSVTP
jgi:hypothetical protein